MTFQQELASWNPFTQTPNRVQEAPIEGSNAPSQEQLELPAADGRPTVITFLRHCGCPFAEKTFLTLRALASTHPETAFVAVSHSSPSATSEWLASLPGPGAGDVRMIVDDQRALYAAWGLGASSIAHVLDPRAMYGALQTGRQDGIWNRPTQSGSRWQTAGSFAVDGSGVVRWAQVSARADEVQRLERGVEKVKG